MKEKEYHDKMSRLLPKDRQETLLSAMEKYGDNKWWLSENPVIIARYQLFENTCMVPDIGKILVGLQKLLGRPVYHHDLAFDVEGLREEAKVAIWKLEGGESLETPFNYKLKKVYESIQLLKNNGPEVIVKETED
ncbi:Uncharacterised protein [uncultured archaeon]|nr:Uncharacterised protein [uncultured archaeon]